MAEAAVRLRCRTPDEARHVISLMLSRGVPPEQIEVLSAEPLHDVGEALTGKSRLPLWVVTGAAVGVAAGWALATVTARLYPLNTGGMPIVSPLPAGIVTYEAMMLLAILFSLAGMLLEAKLLRRQPPGSERFTEAILDGEVHVLARMTSEDEAENLRMVVESGRSSTEV
jgi:ActD protein